MCFEDQAYSIPRKPSYFNVILFLLKEKWIRGNTERRFKSPLQSSWHRATHTHREKGPYNRPHIDAYLSRLSLLNICTWIHMLIPKIWSALHGVLFFLGRFPYALLVSS